MPQTVPQEDYYCRFFSPMTGIIQSASFFFDALGAVFEFYYNQYSS